MSGRVSVNVRYLLWRERIARDRWEATLADRTALDRALCRTLMTGNLQDDQIAPDVLQRLAAAFGQDDGGESIRFADLVGDGTDLPRENLKFLFESLDRGGKKRLAAELSIDPTTVSRWLSGASQPQGPSLRHLSDYFGLPAGTDLRETPIFLSVEPVATVDRRRWLQARIDGLSPDELRDLYPALKRMLEDR